MKTMVSLKAFSAAKGIRLGSLFFVLMTLLSAMANAGYAQASTDSYTELVIADNYGNLGNSASYRSSISEPSKEFMLEAHPMRIMSFNIRGSFRDSGEPNAWINRSAVNVETIRRHAPALIGFQELQRGNLKTYREQLREYAYILGPRYGNLNRPSFNAVFFDPARLSVLDSGGFWLSATPERYSASWGTRIVRSANWVIFASAETGLSFLYLNTHLDHVSPLARREGSRLILQRAVEIRHYRGTDLPIVVTGDFNCRPGSPAYLNFMQGGFEDAYLAAGNEEDEDANTFHDFKGPRYQYAHPDPHPRRLAHRLDPPLRPPAARPDHIVFDRAGSRRALRGVPKRSLPRARRGLARALAIEERAPRMGLFLRYWIGRRPRRRRGPVRTRRSEHSLGLALAYREE